MEKMTYVAALTFAIDTLNEQITASGCADWDEQALAVIEKLTALKTQTEKRNSADRKPTKVQLANESLKAKVLAVLTANPTTVTELMAKDKELSALSNQKVSALVNALVEDGKVTKTVEKRKSYFSLA